MTAYHPLETFGQAATSDRFGDQDAFLPPRLSARYSFSQRTLVGMRGNGRDAPKPAVCYSPP